MNDVNDISELADWTPKKNFKEKHHQFSEVVDGALRGRAHNGLDNAGAVRVIGNQLYINEKRFANWVDTGCRHERYGAPRKRLSDLKSEGEPRKHEGSKAAEHISSKKRCTKK